MFNFFQFPILNRISSVKYRDKDAVLRKINNIIRDGPEKLQVCGKKFYLFLHHSLNWRISYLDFYMYIYI